MILGTGSDILDLTRLGTVLDRFGERFIKRCFTDTERAKAERRRAAGTHIATDAKRFAAKEAVAKALGTGFSQGVFMKDIGVVNDPLGRPTVVLTGGARARLDRMVKDAVSKTGLPLNLVQIHLTLTDEPPMVQAYAIIEII